MSHAPKTAALTAQIVAQETSRHANAWQYPEAYAVEFFREHPGWFGVSVYGPMDASYASKSLLAYAERVGEPLVDVLVEMADAHLQIKGVTWVDPADREAAIEAAREGTWT